MSTYFANNQTTLYQSKYPYKTFNIKEILSTWCKNGKSLEIRARKKVTFIYQPGHSSKVQASWRTSGSPAHLLCSTFVPSSVHIWVRFFIPFPQVTEHSDSMYVSPHTVKNIVTIFTIWNEAEKVLSIVRGKNIGALMTAFHSHSPGHWPALQGTWVSAGWLSSQRLASTVFPANLHLAAIPCMPEPQVTEHSPTTSGSPQSGREINSMY